MIQVQDDSVQLPSKNDLHQSASAANQTAPASKQSSANDQNKIDDLLKQLEDLSQEIEAKTNAKDRVEAESGAELNAGAATQPELKIEAAPEIAKLDEPVEPEPLAAPPVAASLTASAEAEGENKNDEDLDSLIAELEQSLKNLVARKEMKQVDAEPVVAPAPAASPAPSASPKPAADKEDFDLDAFIKDLETKIAQEESKSPAPASNQADNVANEDNADVDFRKNRNTPDIEEPDLEINAAEPSATAPASSSPEPAASQPEQQDPESLAAQNIFEMLGINDVADQEKDQFLSDLENLIWDDFLDTDLPLLLTSQEYQKAKQILEAQSKNELDKKEELLVFLEKLVPDLEEIMYEKALDLKKDLLAERLRKLKEQASDEASKQNLLAAEKMIAADQWRSATNALNKI